MLRSRYDPHRPRFELRQELDMQQNFDRPKHRPRSHASGPSRLALLVYFACLPLFFSANALSWPFAEAVETEPATERDCPIVPTANHSSDEQATDEDDEPDCD